MKKLFLIITVVLIIIQPISAFSLFDFLKDYNINQITGLEICQTETECEESGGVCRYVCLENEHLDLTKSCILECIEPLPSQGVTGGTTEEYCCMPNPPCTENWQCSEWSQCINNQQTRICTDLNNCGTFENKPSETQSCAIQEQNACEQQGGNCRNMCLDTEEINYELTPGCQTQGYCCVERSHCYDGTPFNECSNNFKYCSNGILIEYCNICGCPTNKECINNECVESYSLGNESNNTNLINLPPIFSQINDLSFSINSDLNNILNFNQYTTDPEGETLTFSFNNNQNFYSNVIDCTITNSMLSCNVKKSGLTFLTIKASDGVKSSTCIFKITIFDFMPTTAGVVGALENTPPKADAGIDKTGYINQYIILDASKSYDNENNIINYEWFEDENKIGEGVTIKIKFTEFGKHKITLKVTDAGNEISTDNIKIKVSKKKKCLETNTIYFPEDTICNEDWPSHTGEIIEINNQIQSCDLFEVCNEDLDPIVEDAIDCCDSTGLTDPKKANACNFAIKNSRDAKKCEALYIIKALGSNAIYMQDYFTAEMCCFGVKELCPNPLNWYTARPIPKTNKDLSNIKCLNSQKNNPHGLWLSDTKIELNNIALSDIHTAASVNVLSTGTCVDYSSALTTVLRKLGYSKDDVFIVEASTHSYNLVRFPLDKKFTIIDITGNNDGIKLGKVPPGYKYCENIKNCYNDIGESLCPDNKNIFGCENIRPTLFREGKIIGTKLSTSLKKIWDAIIYEITR